jgi:hypothetical protein
MPEVLTWWCWERLCPRTQQDPAPVLRSAWKSGRFLMKPYAALELFKQKSLSIKGLHINPSENYITPPPPQSKIYLSPPPSAIPNFQSTYSLFAFIFCPLLHLFYHSSFNLPFIFPLSFFSSKFPLFYIFPQVTSAQFFYATVGGGGVFSDIKCTQMYTPCLAWRTLEVTLAKQDIQYNQKHRSTWIIPALFCMNWDTAIHPADVYY